MSSIIWDRDSQEAIDHPYEYPAEEQFVREAKALIINLEDIILEKKHFFLNDKSLEKATWMLQVDVFFAFKDSIEVMDIKKHRLVGPLIRIMYENLHQIEYFNNGTQKSAKALSSWYKNSSPRHFEYREYIDKTKGKSNADFLHRQYDAYSKLTHRTYRSLLYNYGLGAYEDQDQRIWYDEKWPLRQSISMFYAILGMFGKLMIENFKLYGVLTENEVNEAWNNSMELNQIPRGYITPEARIMFGLNQEDDLQEPSI
jgi:hypothetical protein